MMARAIHSPRCRCTGCTPAAPSDAGPGASRIAACVLAGLVLGEVAAFALDRILGGPGLLQQFGW